MQRVGFFCRCSCIFSLFLVFVAASSVRPLTSSPRPRASSSKPAASSTCHLAFTHAALIWRLSPLRHPASSFAHWLASLLRVWVIYARRSSHFVFVAVFGIERMSMSGVCRGKSSALFVSGACRVASQPRHLHASAAFASPTSLLDSARRLRVPLASRFPFLFVLAFSFLFCFAFAARLRIR
jgi:hypothetical protein